MESIYFAIPTGSVNETDYFHLQKVNTARHHTFHTMHLDEIHPDHIHRCRCLSAYSIQSTNGCQLVLEEASYHIILISHHCNFMLVIMYSRILMFE
jgi:hypothetical protein